MSHEIKFKDNVFLLINYLRKNRASAEKILPTFRILLKLETKNKKYIEYVLNTFNKVKSDQKSEVIPFRRRASDEDR